MKLVLCIVLASCITGICCLDQLCSPHIPVLRHVWPQFSVSILSHWACMGCLVWDIKSKSRYSKCHIQMSKQYILLINVSKKTEPAIKLCLPSLMSTIWTNITPPYQLTARLFKSRIWISEALSIALWRIYQQSFMEINCCKWSNSCEASPGQVWEISTITTQSVDSHAVSAQNTLCLLIYGSVARQELLWFSSSVSCDTSKSWIKSRLLYTELCRMHVPDQPSLAPAQSSLRNCQINWRRTPHFSCIFFHFPNDYSEVET